jgi:hypothetical protein
VTDDRGAEIDGHRKHQSAGVVAVATDEVHATRGPHPQLFAHHFTALSSAAADSGTTGLT